MKKRILLIEDDLATIELYKTFLNKADFSVETIRWGEEAIKKIDRIRRREDEKPNLVLLDLILPDINGIKVLEEIRRHKETEDLPVFILTNYSDAQLEKMGRNLRSERYILKTDYTPKQFIKIIKEKLK
ncbi:MAG: response regulator [Candidatus Nealsonbacteria bacterium]|nr:response regulator [Candidatus Nealsonbacteria bacterium]